MDDISKALQDGAVQLIGALVTLIPVAVGVAIAWLNRKAKQIVEDAATEAEIHGREVGMRGQEKKDLAKFLVHERLPKGAFSPSAQRVDQMIEKSLPKARERASKV